MRLAVPAQGHGAGDAGGRDDALGDIVTEQSFARGDTFCSTAV